MELKVKILNERVKFEESGDSKFESLRLFASEMQIAPGQDGKAVVIYKTGVSVEIPEGHVGLVFQEPSVNSISISMVEGVSIVFPEDNNEISLKFKTNTDVVPVIYNEGDPIARMIIVPNISFSITAEPAVEHKSEIKESLEQDNKDEKQDSEKGSDNTSMLEEA